MKAKSVKSAKAPDPAARVAGPGIEPELSSDLLIGAIGASAGGLEAGIDLVRNLDPDSGMAYVFIQHLDPTHHSIIKDLLAKETSMPVTEVTDGAKVVANHIYVIPPNKLLTIEDHVLRLSPRDPSRGAHMPIDHFMRALAAELGNRAIGVILSGTGSDGVLGMAEIQAHGGVTFAQDPASAKYDGMPRSAIGAGCVDYVLPPQEIASELAALGAAPLCFAITLSGLPRDRATRRQQHQRALSALAQNHSRRLYPLPQDHYPSANPAAHAGSQNR